MWRSLSDMKQLWAPWRLEYVARRRRGGRLHFLPGSCRPDADGLVVQRGELAFCLLNKYPYASGHLMAAPYRHVAEFAELETDEVLELHRLAAAGMGALTRTFAPQGYNVGWNLGRIMRHEAWSTTSTSTSSRAGRAIRTSCPCSRT